MFPGFNKRKKNTVSNGDWDRDGVSNRRDCDALNWKKQDGGEVIKPFPKTREEREELVREFRKGWGDDNVSEDNRRARRSYAPGEEKLIKDRLEYHRLKNKSGGK